MLYSLMHKPYKI